MSGRANFTSEVFSEKQKIFQWMRKWLRENNEVEETKNVAFFDLPDLIIVLQCAGFTLHKFQNENETIYTNPSTMNGDTLKIELNCSKSGMKAEMLKAVQCCSCPKSDDIKTEEFFSVTSCAPASKGSFDVSLSSFLPTITHPKQYVIGDIFKELIAIIKNENQTNETETHDVRTTIERMSLDPTKSLMQNLKDIKRVVDSFLDDKEKDDERSFLRKQLEEEKIKTPEIKVEEKKSTVNKAKTKQMKTSQVKVEEKKSTVNKTKTKQLNTTTKLGLVANKNRVTRGGTVPQEKGAVKNKSLVTLNGGNRIVNQKTMNAVAGSASSINKFGRTVRAKTVNKI